MNIFIHRKYDVAEPDHLFYHLDSAALEDGALSAYGGITIERYFKSWSEKAGHPLLTVTIDQRTGEMKVTQVCTNTSVLHTDHSIKAARRYCSHW